MIPSTTARQAILGVPLDLGKKPSTTGVVRAFEQMDARIIANSAGALIKNSLSNLNATVTPAAGSMAWVIGDETVGNNGVYENTGTSGSPVWTRRADLPYGVIRAINVGAGTANAIEVTTAIPIPSADGAAVIILPITVTNDASPVTVAFNGDTALTIKSNAGNDIAIGGLQSGMLVLGFKSGSTFRIITDQVSSAIIAQAEAFADAAAISASEAEAAAALAAQRYIRVHVVDTEEGDPSTDYEASDEIDGVTLVTGMIVLRATEGGDPADGVYVVPASGAASRSAQFDDYDDLPGTAIRVMLGGDNANTDWRVNSAPGGTIDVTDVVIEQFQGGGAALPELAGDADRASSLGTDVTGMSWVRRRNIVFDAVVDGGCDNEGSSATGTAVQDSIDEAADFKIPAYFPDGTYDIAGTAISVSQDDAKVMCQSPATVILKSVDASAPAVSLTGDNARWDGGVLSYSAGTTAVSGDHAGLLVNGVRGARVSGLRVKGRFYVGVYLLNCEEATIDGVVSKGAVNRNFYTAFDGSFGVGFADIVFSNCLADGAETDGGTTPYSNYGFNSNGFGTGINGGIQYIGCRSRYQTSHGFAYSERISYQRAIGCLAHDITGPGFLVQDANGHVSQRHLLDGCFAFRCQDGYHILNSLYVTLSGCYAGLSTGSGFRIQGSSYVPLSGCISENNSGSGFYVQVGTSASTNVMHTGCISAVNAGYGFYSESGSDRIGWVGNVATANVAANYGTNGTNLLAGDNL